MRTAVDGVDASCGRASIGNDEVAASQERSQTGNIRGFEQVLRRAEGQAMEQRAPAEVTAEGRSALALPLCPLAENSRLIGLISVARADRAFTAGEREFFKFLADQVTVAADNVALHELRDRQAVADELSGLFKLKRRAPGCDPGAVPT